MKQLTIIFPKDSACFQYFASKYLFSKISNKKLKQQIRQLMKKDFEKTMSVLEKKLGIPSERLLKSSGVIINLQIKEVEFRKC